MASALYDALAAAEIAPGAFYIHNTLLDLIACSDAQCTAIHTYMNDSYDTFGMLFSKSVYANGNTITATEPAYPADIGFWGSVVEP